MSPLDESISPPVGGRKIIVVDDNDDNIIIYKHLLGRIGYTDVLYYSDANAVMRDCREKNLAPDLFLLDVMMPGVDGLTLATMIKSDERLRDASIIFITARELDETLEKCFEVGGADFVAKPISMVELRCRLSRVFEMQDLHRRLMVQNEELRVCTITDPLTGLFNRRYLDRRLDEECAKSARYRHDLSFLMLDLDHFKQVNDELGHPVGDRVLKQLSTILMDAVRSTDMVARFGGEEFCVMLTGTPLAQAMETAERIRAKVEAEEFLPELGSRDVTVSIGVASYLDMKSESVDARQIIEAADQALYAVKERSRNGVMSASDLD